MQRFFRFFNKEYVNINEAALLLGLFTLFSQFLGLFRDRAIAHYIGPSLELDAYYAAFRIPDLIFISFASLASVTVLVPFLLSKMKGEKITEEAHRFLNQVFTLFFLLMIFISFIVFLFIPKLTNIIAPGFDIEGKKHLIILSRILILSPILLGLSNLFGSISQLFRKFFIFSLSPVFYNLGIIFGIMVLYPLWGIKGVAIGVVIGAFFHFLIQFINSFLLKFPIYFSFKIDFKEIKKVFLTSLPRTLGLSFNHLAMIGLIAIASFYKSGSISVFNLSLSIQSIPLHIIGVSYAVAAFPTFSKTISLGRLDEFKNLLISSARTIVFWSLPITFLFIVLRAQIVRVILGSSSFSWDNTRLVAASFALFSISVLAQSFIALSARAYYANGNTKKPLFINFVSSLFIIIFAFVLNYIFQNSLVFKYFIENLLKVENIKGTEVLMLPLAYSLGTIINFILYWFFIKKDFIKGPFIRKTFFQSLGASFFIAFTSYYSLKIFSNIFGTSTFWGIFLQGFLSGLLGIIIGILILYLFKNKEFLDFVKVFKTKFWKSKIIIPEQKGL